MDNKSERRTRRKTKGKSRDDVAPPYEPFASSTASSSTLSSTDAVHWGTYQASGRGMDAKAGVNEQGGIDIRLMLRSQLGQLPPDYALTVEEPHVEPHPTDVPTLNILIQIVGSRGDVQPYLSLAIELVLCSARHRVRIATHDDFKEFVLDTGKRVLNRRYQGRYQKEAPKELLDQLEFFSIGGSPKELMAYMVKNPGLLPSFTAIRNGEIGSKQRMLTLMMENFYLSTHYPDPVTGRSFVADALLCNPPSFAHVHLAEAFGLPLMISFTMPWSPTTAFKHPLVNIRQTNADPTIVNYLSYGLAEIMTWQGLSRLTNKFRKKIKLQPLAHREGPGIADHLKIPHMYCWSPSMIPKPKDWKEHIDITGYFFLEDNDYEPDPALAAFLSAGPPPIYIGFGSIVVEDPDAFTRIIFAAVEATGVRALVSAGWSKLGGKHIPDNVHLLGNVPHEWLFSNDRVSAVCHHGGAGTTACGIRHGRPTIIIPFFGDQPWQGQMVAAAGAGPSPIPYVKLTDRGLTKAIEQALSPEVRAAAAKLGESIRNEHGELAGVDSFHAHLPLLNMRCNLDPSRVASWWSEELALRMSRFAAETLVARKCITHESLVPHRPRDYHPNRKELYPLAGGVNAVFECLVNGVTGFGMIFYKPHKGLYKFATAAPYGLFKTWIGVSEGLHQLPERYGSPPMHKTQIRGAKSGFISGTTGFYYGFADGLTGLVTTPMRGHKKNGWAGAAAGVGQSLLDLYIKPAAGLMGLIGDPIKGMSMSFTSRSFGEQHPFIKPRTELGKQEASQGTEEERQAILNAFNVAVRSIADRKEGYRRVAEAEAKAFEAEKQRLAEVEIRSQTAEGDKGGSANQPGLLA